jgi:hypothetical protein
MHSGGGLKEKYHHIFIEAPKAEAKVIFFNRFGHNPERVSCTCCGDDYSISEAPTLAEATAYHRGCGYHEDSRLPDGRVAGDGYWFEGPSMERISIHKYMPLGPWLDRAASARPEEAVLVIRAKDIEASERKGIVPEQGYVWRD